MKIVIIGSGYVGLSLATLLARSGYQTVCLDVDKRKVDIINSGKSHFFEIGLDYLVSQGINTGNLTATTDYQTAMKDANIAFLCVGTPTTETGALNLSFIYDSVNQASKYAKDGIIYVQRSTVPVGTGAKAINLIKENHPKLRFHYLSSPEFLREGSAVIDSIFQDRVVLGGDIENDENAIVKVLAIFEKIDSLKHEVIHEIPDIAKFADAYLGNSGAKTSNGTPFKDKCQVTKLESAELIKIVSNAFLSLKISYANMISNLCDKVGADINEVMKGVGADNRIGRAFLYAGLGFGGGCFPKDVKGLINSLAEYDVDSDILNAVMEINNNQVNIAVEKVKKLTKGSIGKIGVLGTAFKQGTSDTRESQSIKLIKKLADLGYSVSIFDPQAKEETEVDLEKYPSVVFEENIEEIFKDSIAVVIATDWPEFKLLDFEHLSKLMKENNIVDARNFIDKTILKKYFNYSGMGVS